MKQVQQSYRSGALGIVDAPAPRPGDGEVFVATRVSLISSGTERQLMQLAKSSLAAKAAARPDLVKRVIKTVRREGLRATAEKVFARLDTPIPLGYSLVGEVVAFGRGVEGLAPGDRVCCAGAALANHAEYNVVPKNLVVAAPKGVSDEDASFVTLGAIALQGVRVAAPTLGEWVVVTGLGLIVLLTVQLLKANGCRVIGFDPNPERAALARDLGADEAVSDGLHNLVLARTRGYGADAVIVAASAKSSDPVNQAAEMSRVKGRVVVVGLVGLSIDREPFYKRELDLRFSMSYGPGRGDPAYEQEGADYPLAYVRWTEQRNMAAFLDLIEAGRVTPQKYVTHRFAIGDAEQAYALMERNAPHLAILLTYPPGGDDAPKVVKSSATAKAGQGVAFVGFGNYARSVLLPRVKAAQATLTAVVTKTGLSASHSAQKYGFAIAATDASAAFDDPATGAVFIATRHDTHADLAARALAAGKHVFCEKPLALDLEGLDRAISAARASSGHLTVGFNRRFAPLLVEMKREIGARVGPLAMLYRVNAGPTPADSWIQRGEGGGRVLGEVCHFIDALTFLADSLPVEAQAVRTGGLSDCVSILLAFADGSTGTILYSSLGDPAAPKEYVEVFARDKTLRLEDFSELTAHVAGKARKRSAKQDKGQTGLVSAFLAAAREGAKPPIPLDEIEAVSRMTIVIEEALRGV